MENEKLREGYKKWKSQDQEALKLAKLEQKAFVLARVDELDAKLGSKARVKTFLQQIPDKFVVNHAKSIVGKRSLTNAIRCKCLDCACWQTEEVKNCETITCPLWKLRPYQKKDKKL